MHNRNNRGRANQSLPHHWCASLSDKRATLRGMCLCIVCKLPCMFHMLYCGPKAGAGSMAEMPCGITGLSSVGLATLALTLLFLRS